ncbi:MAG: TetR/AcrR family transcriptional regulator [Caldilineaceae bacterium]|nr:TetR/AcrR family transcriptional regulator [Caldilineaceae bacterium]
MPKETFFNLPDEKRERITAVAIEEFGHNEYADVSISRIVAKAGIAKGSFYQYFEDKEDLYAYLLDLIMEKKKEFFSLDHPDPQHIGVFLYLRWMAQAGARFELAHPELMQVGYRAVNQTVYPKTFMTHAQQETRLFYMRLVATAKAQGDIAPEVDDELAAFMFDTIITALGQYLLSRAKDYPGVAHGHPAFYERPDVVRIFDQTINILEHGMGVSQAVQVSAAVEAAQG